MEQVSVVLPLCTAAPGPDEWAAIDQCCAVLARHPLTIVAPHSLDLGTITRRYPQLLVERFDDAYFRSVADYNRLMLSVEFYARFQRYEFVLRVYPLPAVLISATVRLVRLPRFVQTPRPARASRWFARHGWWSGSPRHSCP
jgi:hypothetical protein